MQILVALYAVYYSFLVLRVNSDYKELQKNLDSLFIFRADKDYQYNSILIEVDKLIIGSPKDWVLSEKSRAKIIEVIYKKRPDYKPDNNIVTAYLQIIRLSQKSLTRSEWGIIIGLTISIVFLAFVMREKNLTSMIITFIICCSSVFCDFVLYNEEQKKKRMLNQILKFKI
jgi:hypothetical protein